MIGITIHYPCTQLKLCYHWVFTCRARSSIIDGAGTSVPKRHRMLWTFCMVLLMWLATWPMDALLVFLWSTTIVKSPFIDQGLISQPCFWWWILDMLLLDTCQTNHPDYLSHIYCKLSWAESSGSTTYICHEANLLLWLFLQSEWQDYVLKQKWTLWDKRTTQTIQDPAYLLGWWWTKPCTPTLQIRQISWYKKHMYFIASQAY